MSPSNPPLGMRRTAWVIWAALLFGVLAFAAVASYVGPGLRAAGTSAPLVLADVALAFAAVCVATSRWLPPRLRPPAGAEPESFALTRNIVAAALCEGSSLLATIAWMLTGSGRAAVAWALAVAGLVACIPGDARWRSLVGAQPVQRGTGGPPRMVR